MLIALRSPKRNMRVCMGNKEFVLETKLRNEINELKAITFIIKCKYCYQVSSSFFIRRFSSI